MSVTLGITLLMFHTKAFHLDLVEGVGKKCVCFYSSEYIKRTCYKIKTSQMHLVIIRYKQEMKIPLQNIK